MNDITVPDVITEREEVEILSEIWNRQIANQQGLRKAIESTIEQAEIIAKRFETHHRAMRYTINQLENLLDDLVKIEEEYKENQQEVLPYVINNPKRTTVSNSLF